MGFWIKLTSLFGAGAKPEATSGPIPDPDQPIETIPLPGFDPDGEPEIRRLADNSLWLVFNFMPPSWIPESEYEDLGRCQDFDRRLEAAISTPVVWEDREFFWIKQPRPDTVEKVKQFLVNFRREHDPRC